MSILAASVMLSEYRNLRAGGVGLARPAATRTSNERAEESILAGVKGVPVIPVCGDKGRWQWWHSIDSVLYRFYTLSV